jgi:predicted ribosomally synthesized peptide with nif11-like leader
MSTDHAKAFLLEVERNDELRKKISACSDASERMALAKESGFEFTAEEFSEVRSLMFCKELDDVSGGSCCGYSNEETMDGHCRGHG